MAHSNHTDQIHPDFGKLVYRELYNDAEAEAPLSVSHSDAQFQNWDFPVVQQFACHSEQAFFAP
jgi:hypothetical protein